jgi:hypothetical protein
MSLELSTPVVVDRLESLHREMPWIALSPSAEVPPGEFSDAERERLLQDILGCRRSLAVAQELVRKRQGATAVEPREVRDAWRKFFVSHCAFFHTFALLASRYRAAAAALEQGEWPQREVDQACALWRLAGALMLYGVDFSPTDVIYQEFIRPRMPQAFSGTWLREHVLLSDCRREFERALESRLETDRERCREIKARLAEGEKRYHQFHFQVMVSCVPELTSKLQEYQMEHGKLSRDETHFQAYDEWFHVLRLADIDFSVYVRSMCAVFSELLADLVEGTFLEPQPLAALTAGISTVLEILRSNVGGEPLPEVA